MESTNHPGRRATDEAIAGSLVVAIVLWGANNTGLKYLVASWPPVLVGAARFGAAGLVLLAILRWSRWLGAAPRLAPREKSLLWWRAGASLAVYIVMFNWALRLTTAANVALYLGVSPLVCLLVDTRPAKDWPTLKRYLGAVLALAGVAVLFWPALRLDPQRWLGELLAFVSSLVWAYHSFQCRRLTATLSGVVITAHTMWRASVLLAPIAFYEALTHPIPVRGDLCLVQLYCILGGGVAAFGLWNTALRYWPTSQVFLFINLSPLSTMAWAHFCLGEKVSPTYFPAMTLIIGGVLLAELDLGKEAAGNHE